MALSTLPQGVPVVEVGITKNETLRAGIFSNLKGYDHSEDHPVHNYTGKTLSCQYFGYIFHSQQEMRKPVLNEVPRYFA